MKILALEFSSNKRSVALASRRTDRSIQILSQATDISREVTGLALIDRTFQHAQLSPAEVTDIIVGLGPGSYTGIRSALALAQGWQLGRGVRVTGIGSIQCLAAHAGHRGLRGDYSFIVDAQRGDVYHQIFRLNDQSIEPLTDVRIIPSADALKFPNLIGPDARKFAPYATELSPSAEFLAFLLDLGQTVPAEQLEPIYLREATFAKAPPARHIN